MKALLIMPDLVARDLSGIRQRSELTWTTDHPASHNGTGVLLHHNGEILDGFNFRGMRDMLGATIETNDPQRVCRALGVPEGEPGIEVIP